MDRLRTSQGRTSARPGGIRVLLAIATAVAVAAAGLVGGSSAAGKPAGKPVAIAKKAAAQTPKKSMWGPVEAEFGRPLFPIFKQLGVGLYSNAVRWDQVAPTTRPANPTDPNDPAYTWPSYLTESLAAAEANGMQTQVLVLGTPPWANGGKDFRFVPDNFKDFGDFSQAISKRYPSVDHWMVWGEPNRAPNFQPFTPATNPTTKKLTAAQQVAPVNYAQLLDAAYTGFKAADPGDNVIGGNTYTSAGKDDINPYQWIRYLKLPNGSRPRMDMWGHNPYGFDLPELTPLSGKPAPRGTVPFSDLRFLVRELDRNFPGKRFKLFLSEWGVPVGFKDKDLLYSLPPKEAKEWVKAGYEIARTYKRIFTLGWIHPVDTDRASQGLLDRTGKQKPTFKTFKS
ncbi:MAG: hypothetical protein H0V15_01110, partial [Solirubrobacterales bacterium]|nr:hypothetical protein [Solirubrobacterales bacterium]